MAENPFGDDTETRAPKKNYLLLISVNEGNAAAIKKALGNIKETIDKNAWPLWVDSKGLGVFIETDVVAWEIRHAAFLGATGDFTSIKDAMVIEMGHDWYASEDSPMKNWLMAHVGAPLVPPLDSRLRRRKDGHK